MVSLQKCRELLGNDSTLTDSALELLRDHLYVLADITTTEFIAKRRTEGFDNLFQGGFQAEAFTAQPTPAAKVLDFEEFVKPLSHSERDEAEERAAILEFDAGMERQQAERIVVMEHWRSRNLGVANNG